MNVFRINPEIKIIYADEKMMVHNVLTSKNYVLEKEYAEAAKQILENNNIEEAQKFVENSVIEEVIEYFSREKIGKVFSAYYVVPKLKNKLDIMHKSEKFQKLSIETAVLELTGQCNLDCIFCKKNFFGERRCGCIRSDSKELLNEVQWMNLADQIISLGVKKVEFCGGEPLLKKELLLKLINKFIDKNILVVIYTNGILLDQKIIEEFYEKNVVIIVQIVASSKTDYDKITNTQGDFETLIKNISLLNYYNLRTRFLLLINKKSQNALKQLENILISGKYGNDALLPSNSESIYDTNNIDFRTGEIKLNFTNFEEVENKNFCLNQRLFIDSDGKIFPCVMIRNEVLGDVKKEKLYKIFFRSEYKKYWNYSNSEDRSCSNCIKRLLCENCKAYVFNRDININKTCKNLL